MILTKTVKFKLNQFNSHHFKRLGYEVEGKDEIDVKIEDVGKASSVKVLVKCDFCEKEKCITYIKYRKNISRHNLYACSNKCAVEKGEKTCIEKYGTKYALQNEKIKENLRNYFLDKFGHENPSQNESVKQKRKLTCIEKYGVESNLILPEVHKKAIELSLNKESTYKKKETLLKRFGVDNPMKSKEVYEKFKKTNLKKYGREFPAQNTEIFLKTQKSGLKIKYFEGILYQGTYELDLLILLKSLNLIDKVQRGSEIEYSINESKHVYYPDFFLPLYNLIIEVKSCYYYNLNLEKNLAKERACRELGYNFLFVLDKDYDCLLNILKNKAD
jgi:hypothetical protein